MKDGLLMSVSRKNWGEIFSDGSARASRMPPATVPTAQWPAFPGEKPFPNRAVEPKL